MVERELTSRAVALPSATHQADPPCDAVAREDRAIASKKASARCLGVGDRSGQRAAVRGPVETI